MKKILIVILAVFSLASCNNASKQETATAQEAVTEDVRLLSGEFIYIADAAVLKGRDFIYGVVLDEMTEELAKQVAPKKRDEFDMVPVTIKGVINRKPEGTEGWDEVVTIKEIVKISEPKGEAPIKIESTQE